MCQVNYYYRIPFLPLPLLLPLSPLTLDMVTYGVVFTATSSTSGHDTSQQMGDDEQQHHIPHSGPCSPTSSCSISRFLLLFPPPPPRVCVLVLLWNFLGEA